MEQKDKKIVLGQVINGFIEKENSVQGYLFIPDKSGSFEVNCKSSEPLSAELMSQDGKSNLAYAYFTDEIRLASTLISGKSYYIKISSEKHKQNYVKFVLQVQQIVEPSVKYFRYQWGLLNKKSGLDINVLPVWKQMKGKTIQRIGIADTGIDNFHVDLQGKVDSELGYNFVHNTKEAWNLDEMDTKAAAKNGHGSYVAGIIGARQDRENGIMGIVPNVDLVSLKILGSPIENFAVFNEATESFIQAIEYARRKKIRIINCSFSGVNPSEKEKKAIIDAKDILFIMAAGNEKINLGIEPRYPACYDTDNSIVVAAVDRFGRLYSTSNYGGPTDIAAPGDTIVSLYQDNQYIVANGTSAAAPFVTGVCSLLMSERYNLSPAMIKQIIVSKDNVTRVEGLEGLTRSGGVLNAYKAIICSKTYHYLEN